MSRANRFVELRNSVAVFAGLFAFFFLPFSFAKEKVFGCKRDCGINFEGRKNGETHQREKLRCNLERVYATSGRGDRGKSTYRRERESSYSDEVSSKSGNLRKRDKELKLRFDVPDYGLL